MSPEVASKFVKLALTLLIMTQLGGFAAQSAADLMSLTTRIWNARAAALTSTKTLLLRPA